MKVKLKIVQGTSAGKEVRLPLPKCLIGRSDECHMRPKSEAISRRHCVIYVKGGKVHIRDLKSRNGTIVNGQKMEGDQELKNGDQIQIGPLAFEIMIDHALGGEKKPKVSSVAEAAARTTGNSQDAVVVDDGDISDWLDEADQLERVRRLSDPETRQLRLDETDQVKLQRAIEERAQRKAAGGEVEPLVKRPSAASAAEESKEAEQPKKKVPGKLPPRAEKATKDSQEAASDMLKKFFNKR